ncbi:hypothetical protein, partial [Vibrio cholerae]|uniref:hypothetical protein n=1 Tax=Vibrio cholerae TaxID=666 RepID=UPI0005B2F15B
PQEGLLKSNLSAVVSVVVFGFSGMRCQPLRRALYRFNLRTECLHSKNRQQTAFNVTIEV